VQSRRHLENNCRVSKNTCLPPRFPRNYPFPQAGDRPPGATSRAFATFAQAQQVCAANPHYRLGLELGNLLDESGLGVLGIDLDTCFDPDKPEAGVAPWAVEIMRCFHGAYAERSPSGTGIKLFLTFEWSRLAEFKAALGGRKKFSNGGKGHAPAIEVFLESRYFAVTCQVLPGFDGILPCTPEALAWLADHGRVTFPKGKQAKGKAPKDENDDYAIKDNDNGSRPWSQQEEDTIRSALTWLGGNANGARHADDYETWINYGMALKRLGWGDRGRALWIEFSRTASPDVHEGTDFATKWEKAFPPLAPGETIIGAAQDAGWTSSPGQSSPSSKGSILGAVLDLNTRFFLLQDYGGKCVVGAFEQSPDLGVFPRFNFWKRNEFTAWYANCKYKRGEDLVGLGTIWLEHPKRLGYRGLVLEPGGEEVVDGRINPWRGFAVESQEGDCRLLTEHVRTILAQEDDGAYNDIMNRLAWKVQNPGEQPGTALNLSRQEEDRQRTHSQKGVNIFPVRNRIGLFMATNENWVVPVSSDEGRFIIYNVWDRYAPDVCSDEERKHYFDALANEIKAGGDAAFLHVLQHRPLGKWHPRIMYKNEALSEQMRRSLSTKRPMDARPD
jgi:Primase C terminal 2 (PriCT-2)